MMPKSFAAYLRFSVRSSDIVSCAFAARLLLVCMASQQPANTSGQGSLTAAGVSLDIP